MEMRILPPSDYNPKWTVTGDAAERLRCPDNNDAEDLIRLDAPVDAEWDSESGQMFAYVNTENDADTLMRYIEEIAAHRDTLRIR